MKRQKKLSFGRSKREKWTYVSVILLVILIPPSFNSIFGVYGASQLIAYAIALLLAESGRYVWERWGRDQFPLPAKAEAEVAA